MKRPLILLGLCCCLSGGESPAAQLPSPSGRTALDYAPSRMCRGCHDKIVDEHLASNHESSFTNPAFQRQYFRELLPQLELDPALIEEARHCIACHAPVAYKKRGGVVTRPDQVDPEMSGVTCDVCHTIRGYLGGRVGNGNFLSEPSERKFGPFMHENPWHHVYAELQTRSEICGICHNAVNRKGLEIKATFTEWQTSPYAREGIQCQDCHMTLHGFLTAGRPTYDSGQAANTTLARIPVRSRLYTHRFPGAHSGAQVAGALTLALELEGQEAIPGRELLVQVSVHNERTGHKMPSGSADLRLLWLTLEADIGGKHLRIPAASRKSSGTYSAYDVAGRGPFDQEMLGADIPTGSRIYRAIYVDDGGRQTLRSYQATRIVFDNRLEAAEIRKETYRFLVPPTLEGSITLRARLEYLRYPSRFAQQLGLSVASPVEVAAAEKRVGIRSRP